MIDLSKNNPIITQESSVLLYTGCQLETLHQLSRYPLCCFILVSSFFLDDLAKSSNFSFTNILQFSSLWPSTKSVRKTNPLLPTCPPIWSIFFISVNPCTAFKSCTKSWTTSFHIFFQHDFTVSGFKTSISPLIKVTASATVNHVSNKH